MIPTNFIQRLYKKIVKPIYHKKYDWNDKEVFFIVSTGRTATQFLAKYLQANYSEEVIALHEPVPDLLNTGIDKLRGTLSTLQLVNHIKLNRSLQCRAIEKSTPAKIYIESNNNVTVSMYELKKVFPKIKFIHVIRDPRTYIGSSINKINKSNSLDYTMYSPTDNRPRITPMDYNENITQKDWIGFSQFKKVAWYWAKMNNLILDYSSNNNNIITVKYEDIFLSDDHKGLNHILDFIGLSKDTSNHKFPLTKKMNEASGTKDVGINQWTEEQKEFYRDYLSKTALKFNY